MKIWLDDEFAPFTKRFLFDPGIPRELHKLEEGWTWVKNPLELYRMLAEGEPVDIFCVDNDLGAGWEEGVQILRDIRVAVQDEPATRRQFAHTTFYIITNNSAIAREMRQIAEEITLICNRKE